jgi:hypothetical protein
MTWAASLEGSRAQWSAKPQTQQGRPCRLKCLADRRCACRLPSKKNPSLAGLSGQGPKSFFRWATLRKRGQSRLRLGKDVPDRAAGKDCRKSYRRFRCERSGLRGWVARDWKGCAHGSLDGALALGGCSFVANNAFSPGLESIVNESDPLASRVAELQDEVRFTVAPRALLCCDRAGLLSASKLSLTFFDVRSALTSSLVNHSL